MAYNQTVYKTFQTIHRRHTLKKDKTTKLLGMHKTSQELDT